MNYEEFIKYCVTCVVERKMQNKFSKDDLEFYYNNPQIRYHLLLKPNSYLKRRYNNQLPSENLKELITEEEFIRQAQVDSNLSEIIYHSIYFLNNLRITLTVQLMRAIIFIAFLVCFYLFLKEFFISWYKIVYVIILFIASLIGGKLLINYWCMDKKEQENASVQENTNEQEKLKLLKVERK